MTEQQSGAETALALVGRHTDAAALVSALASAGMQVTVVADADDLCRRITGQVDGPGAVIVAEEALPEAIAARLAAALDTQPAWSSIPIIVLLASAEPPPHIAALAHATILQRPVRLVSLVSILRMALADRGRQYQIREHLRALARASERKDMLLGELAHRVKNTLAIIQAIISETRRQSETMDEFVVAVEGRLRSLAISHDALQNSRWAGGDLETILTSIMSPFIGDAQQRLVRAGPPVTLRPEATQAMSMIFHELASNAAKYGALSCETGTVRVQWDVADRQLRIRWQEEGGPPVTPPQQRGYGSMLVEQLAPYQFGGASSIRYEPAGICCEISLPQKNLAPALPP